MVNGWCGKSNTECKNRLLATDLVWLNPAPGHHSLSCLDTKQPLPICFHHLSLFSMCICVGLSARTQAEGLSWVSLWGVTKLGILVPPTLFLVNWEWWVSCKSCPVHTPPPQAASWVLGKGKRQTLQEGQCFFVFTNSPSHDNYTQPRWGWGSSVPMGHKGSVAPVGSCSHLDHQGLPKISYDL